jgi:tetratricopeptide (TPR) repeat protein
MRTLGAMLRLCLTLLLAATSSAAAEAGSQRQSARFFRLASATAAARAETLRQAASEDLEHAAQASAADFHTLCERAQSIPAGTQRDRAIALFIDQLRQRREWIDRALLQLTEAEKLDHADPRTSYLRGLAFMRWEEPADLSGCRVRRKTEQAIEAFSRLQRSDPLFEASQVAFQLGLLFTRAHAFEAAADSYKRSIALAFESSDTASAQANLGEVTMLAGDPAGALEHYDEARKLVPGGRDYALVAFGSAVALDRLGEHAAAVQRGSQAIEAAGRSLGWLHGADVFFEPAYELDYYEALAHEALAELVPATRELATAAAISGYRRFLAAAEPDNPYRANAERNLHQLEARDEAEGRR